MRANIVSFNGEIKYYAKKLCQNYRQTPFMWTSGLCRSKKDAMPYFFHKKKNESHRHCLAVLILIGTIFFK